MLERIDGIIEKAMSAGSSSSCSSSSSSSSADGNGDEKKKKNNNKKSKNALALMLSAVDPETGGKATREELRDQILTKVREECRVSVF